MQQLTPLAAYSDLAFDWSIVINEGAAGLTTIRQHLAATLSDCLVAHVTILCRPAMFFLIIHDHRQKVAIPGHIYPGTEQPYEIQLDGWPVNNSTAFMTIIHKYH